MRTIRRSTRFKKDFKRLIHGQFGPALLNDLPPVLALLSEDLPLPPSARDHSLTGDKFAYRDCHIKPDLILLYRKLGETELLLARLGTHSELGL